MILSDIARFIFIACFFVGAEKERACWGELLSFVGHLYGPVQNQSQNSADLSVSGL